MVRHGPVLSLLSLSFLLVSALHFAPAANAQAETLYDFALTVEPGLHIATLQDGATAHVTFTDHSRDSPQGLVPGSPSGGVLAHTVTLTVTPGFENHAGWQAGSLGSIASVPGESYTKEFKVQVFAQATNPYYLAHVNATIDTTGGRFYRTGDILFFTRGIPGFTLLPGPSIDSLQALQIKQASLQVYNVASVKRSFDFTVSDNPCGLDVAPPPTTVVFPRQFQSIE
ncbi:MAG: hypothetical protein QOG31_400, partial [Thermoplasmata archaeon]|nr:hypothetical protein [Thermoplasmata archaeon]